MNDLDDRSRQFAADRHRHGKLTHDLREIDALLRRHEQSRARWQEAVGRAGEDLRKLEGLSLAALFHTILGDRHEKIDADREVLLRAKLKHDECEAAMEPLANQRAQLQRELADLGDLGQRHAELLRDREAAILARGGEASARAAASADRLGVLESTLREIDEAIAAGRQATAALDSAAAELRGARSWGRVDMLGGGMLVTHAKHGKIDAARSWVDQAQRHLLHFARELEDVGRTVPAPSIDISGFDKFADYFFDGLIFDWHVQTKVDAALDKVTVALDRTQQTVWELERRAKAARESLEGARRERTAWIEGAG